MTYKTIASVNQKGQLELKDGKLEKIGDHIFAYHAVLALCDKKIVSEVNKDFFISELPGSGFYSQYKVTFSADKTPQVAEELEKIFPGIEISGKEKMNIDSHVNSQLVTI
ncbi:hypothetical protein E3983_06180 [Legionella israelensis]|uniref:Uncharacterized protein n=1 Tax=Legionella israelensis TaxID=454 RepID=A0A0W0VK34_9GAMM|nr:hypothetical protein [Legionella israelensis]KTD20465.1 hypothetical protein Lisr_1710 [Legionella israelensis]QBR83973.1 hypothetical protein E3983_06180 [Legionella israelensis]QBS10856.1 hypothetical protein E4T55_14015 [Legionella israelensis]SCX86978.1 hypothetical protein SAMN02746069_00505 [Legionella israelensis DSM 19235]STX57834.1 Uncharacterised protein [Legionella israelensis]